jgi:integrase
VFATETGRPMYHRMSPSAVLTRLPTASAGLNPEGKPRLQPHDLRRTFGSHLALSGLDVVRVSRQIAHSRPSVTLDIYAREFEQAGHADAVAEKMPEAFGRIIEPRGL